MDVKMLDETVPLLIKNLSPGSTFYFPGDTEPTLRMVIRLGFGAMDCPDCVHHVRLNNGVQGAAVESCHVIPVAAQITWQKFED